jgi:EmrB/QacA subfamily drug resistance transporter
MASSINIALPAIGEDLQVDAVMLSWIATAYLMAVAVSLMPFGRLADIHGRKRVFTLGTIIFILSSFFCAFSSSISTLLFFRVIQGIGNSMVFSTGVALLVSVYPPQERGKILGINIGSVYTGLSAGPFLGGILTQHFTWRSVFLVTIPFSMFILFLIFRWLKSEWADAKGEKFDLLGTIIYIVAITGIIFGISLMPQVKGYWVTLAGFICVLIFVKWELKVRQPVFDVRLFKTNRVFAFSNLAALINYCATFALTFLLSLYLQKIKGLSPQSAGLVLVSQPVVMAILSPPAGRLSDRIDPRIVATLGMIITTIGLFFLTFLKQGTSLGYPIGCLILMGFGFALFSSPNANAVMGSVDKRFFGIASGTLATMRSLGMMLSMGITTFIFSIFIGRIRITEEQYPLLMKSTKVAFMIFTLLCLTGVFASLVRGKVRSNEISE